MSHRLVLDGGGQRHSLTYFCCPGSRVLPLPRMYFQGRIRLFGAEGRREKPRSCDMPGIPNQVVVVTEDLEVATRRWGTAGLRTAGTQANERLGLTPADLAVDAARREDAARTLWADVPDNEPTVPRKPDEQGRDPLPASLRDRCRLRYSGWTPTMGKNRLLHASELLPCASVVGFGLPRPTGRPDGVSPERPAVPEDGSSATPGAGRDHRRPDGATPARGGRLPGRSRQARPAPRGRRTPAGPVVQCRRMPRIRSSAS